MVALLTGLKLRLLRNRLRSETWVLVGLVVAAVMGLGAAGLASVGAVLLSVAPEGVAATVVVFAGSVVVVGWAVVPVLAFGVDETLDPARFATLPVRARDLVPGLTVAGALGVPGIATALVALSLVGTWSGSLPAAALAVLCAPVGLVTCVLASRTTTTLAARAFTRRGREVSALLGVVLFIAVTLTPSLLAGSGVGRSLDPERVRAVAHVLAWTPLGLVWAAPADVAAGLVGRGLLRFGLSLVVVAALGLVWERLLAGSLERPPATSAGGRVPSRRRHAVLDRLPDGVAWAVAARSLRYWRRDPRYVVIVVTSVLAAAVPLTAIGLGGARSALVATGPYVAFLLALSTSNSVGYDGSAFAAHLLSGVPGRADRIGRAIGLLLWALPLVVVLSAAGAVLAGRPGLVPACIGAGAGMLLGGTGASALMGAWLPYPVVEAGGNPFQTNAGGGVQAILAQFSTMLAAVTVGLPGLGGLVLSSAWLPWLAWPTLLLGVGAGAVGLWAGLEIGGRAVDDRGPEILAAVRRGT
ncbi:transporter [Kineosporia sp. A_224]|uniref:transporter n=1 Tax=Kineosporia sp. A_224 TaxID=1962180 RepID=UPI000B4AB9EE|nr:transporter [Kineosporia sp. A_224]